MSTNDKNKESGLRRRLKKGGFRLIKSRVRNTHIDNMGGYMIVTIPGNSVQEGRRFELSLQDVEELTSDYGL